jgi:Ni,Fe-hydrogenase maturation factor
MKTIFIGLGNLLLGDDGVGWKVVEEVRKRSRRGRKLSWTYYKKS